MFGQRYKEKLQRGRSVAPEQQIVEWFFEKKKNTFNAFFAK